eukprot:g2468.t1
MPKKKKKNEMPATNTSQTSAQEITSDRQCRLAARDKYALEVARAVEKEMEAEYTAKIPKYNKKRKLVVAEFSIFFAKYMRRCNARCAVDRATAVDENVLPHTLPELVGKMQEYLGEDGESGVVGVWPAAVMRIPRAMAERLHERQSLTMAVEANEKIEQMVAEYVEECACRVGKNVQLWAAGNFSYSRIGGILQELRDDLEEATLSASRHLDQGKSSSSSTQTREDEAFSAFFFQILCECHGGHSEARVRAAGQQFCKRVTDQAKLALVKRLEDLGFSVDTQDWEISW